MKLLCLAILACFLAIANTGEEARNITELGDTGFESVDISELPEADKQYLGLRDHVKPILANVDADLIIFEFMNIYCHNCKVQAIMLNKLHIAIENDPVLRSRAKIVSIAAA